MRIIPSPFVATLLAANLLVALGAGPALAATGQDLFNDQCAECHGTDAASTATAPTLKGVYGRKIASLSDFQYSAALKGKGGTWTDATLGAFLADPKTFAPGTTMFGGAADGAQRQAIIDYLKSLK